MSTSLVQAIDQRTPLSSARLLATQPLRKLDLAIVTGIGFVMIIASILLLLGGVLGSDLAFVQFPLWLIGFRMFVMLAGFALFVMGIAGLVSAFVELVTKMLTES